MRQIRSWKPEILILIISIMLISFVSAVDLQSSSFNSNSTTITSGGSQEINSSTFKGIDINLNSLSGISNATQFESRSGFTNNLNREIIEESAEATEVLEETEETPVTAEPSVTRQGKRTLVPEIEPGLIKEKIKQGETIQKTISIRNPGDETLPIIISVTKLENFTLIDFERFDLKPKEERKIKITFFASEFQIPDIFSGFIEVKTGKSLTKIPTILEVQKRKALFDIQVSLNEVNKYLFQEEQATAEILLINFGDLKPVDVNLTYSLRDLEGKDLDLKTETLAVTDELRFNRTLRFPPNLNLGEYLFYAKVEYQDEVATSAELIHLVETKPSSIIQAQQKVNLKIGFSLLNAIIILGLISLISLVLIKRQKTKQRPLEEQLIEFIKEASKQNIDNETIRKMLVANGWPLRLINKFLPSNEMPSPTEKLLVNYIKKAREQGSSEEVIKSELLNAGWPKKLIAKYLA